MVRLRGKRPDVALAMALPDAQPYQSLLEETREPLKKLGVGVYFVGSDGRVDEAIPAS